MVAKEGHTAHKSDVRDILCFSVIGVPSVASSQSMINRVFQVSNVVVN